MSGAELKVQLTGLGLPPSWLAEQLGVTMRTVVRWFDIDEVPASAIHEIEQVSALTLDEMRRMLSEIDGGVVHTLRTDDDSPDGLPASWHRALTFRVLEHLHASGTDVAVAYR